MTIITDIEVLQEKITSMQWNGVGLIHTKGGLHDGHRKLIGQARKENQLVIVSNLLIPREFSSQMAYELYPRCTKQDQEIAESEGADFFFMPHLEAFETTESSIGIKLKEHLKQELNGIDRPSYYEEQLTTLVKLIQIVKPSTIYMSDKDLQQVYFTKKLLTQFFYHIKLTILPVVRDETGLVLGAKNKLLKDDERKQVIEMRKIFTKAQNAVARGMLSSRKIKWHIENEMSKLYLCQLVFAELVDTERLRKIETITDEAILMIGIKVGNLRIQDYIRLKRTVE